MKYLIFKAGNYPQGSVSEADVEEIARNYDRAYHEAPLTINHYDDPIFGMVESVEASGGSMYASFGELDPWIVEQVNAGKYRKPSIEIADYTDKGKYLRAVTLTNFPQVKALPRLTFDDNGVKKEVQIFSDSKINFKLENKPIKKMDITKFTARFKKFSDTMPATAEELIDTLFGMIESFKKSQQDTEAAMEDLKTKLQAFQDEKVSQLISSAKASGKLNNVAAFEELAKTNYEQAVKLLEAIPEPNIFQQTQVKTGMPAKAGAGKLTYKEIIADPKLAANYSETEMDALRKEFLNIN